MKKLLLLGVCIYINWIAFFVLLIINIIKTAIMDEPHFIHWGYLIAWFIINIALAIIIVKYFMRNSGKIAGKMMKSSAKTTENFFNGFDKEMKKR